MKSADQKPKILVPAENDPSFRWAAIGFLILVEVMIYTKALFHGFVGYDFVFRELYGRSLTSLWTEPTDILARWRPLAYTVNHALFWWFGETPFLWHAFSFLVHFLSVFLFFRIALRFSESFDRKGLIGPTLVTILFQIHPAAVQNVYWASGFSDLLSMVFLLAATAFCFREPQSRGVIVFTSVFFLAGLLSKESAVFYPVFLTIILLLKEGSWKSLLKRYGRLLLLLASLSILFVILYAAVAGELLLGRPFVGFSDASLIFLRGFAMIVLPTDALSIYQIALSSPWIIALAALIWLAALVVVIRKRLASLWFFVSWFCAFVIGLSVYVVGGYLSLRLMYPIVGFWLIAGFGVFARKEWKQRGELGSRVLTLFILVFLFATVMSSISAVLDWHVADKFGKAIRASFVDYFQFVPEKEYLFGAIPSRIRQAEIVGEVSTDFRGQLRQDEMADTVDMHSLFRIVLLDRNDVSANIRVFRVSETSLIFQTQTENQFFLSGKPDVPHELPVGTVFHIGVYTIEVLETILNNRATAVQVSVPETADLDRLLFYDDDAKGFVPFQALEVVLEERSDE